MNDPTGGERSPADDPEAQSLAWGWVGSLAVVALTGTVLVGATLWTPGAPNCRAYTGAGVLLRCPWVRDFVANAAILFVAVAAGATVAGLLVGGVRVAVRIHSE